MRAVAIDTETLGLNWFDGETAFMVTWSFADENYDHMVTMDDPDPVGSVRSMLDSLHPGDAVVFHNAKFDIHQLMATYGIDLLHYFAKGIILHETELLARVVVPFGAGGTTRYRLKHLGNLFLDAGADEEEQEILEAAKSIGLRTLKASQAYYKVWRAYPALMEAYAKKDTRLTINLWTYLMGRLNAHENQRLQDIYVMELAVCPTLVRAERRGVTLDRERVKVLRTKYRREAKALHTKLTNELGDEALDKEAAHEGDTTMAGALREALLGLGVPLYKKTDTGILSTAKGALMEFEEDFPILSDLREWRTVSKFLATYIDPIVERDVVHCNFGQLAAWTGRMSCRQPNMQNIPKGETGARSVFVPREGYAFVVADYSSIEAFLLAYYLGDKAYRKLVSEQDPHAWLTSLVDHGDEDHIDLYLKGTPGQKRRDDVKNTTYAIMYGGGGPRISAMLGIPVPEAKSLISRVKSHLPGFHSLNASIRAKVKRVGYVNTAFGREQAVNKDKAYVGMSGLIQGTAADIMKLGVIECQRRLDEHPEWDAQILLVVHDELVVECKVEYAEECYAVTEGAMESVAAHLDPPIKVEGTWTTENYGVAK